MLRAEGFAATRYHAGLDPEERQANQEVFLCDRAAVMVATNAFGMGIDKSNVSYVIHYNMPKSLEAYYQEAGRAGRDGSAADCILLYGPGDMTTAKFLILNSSENEALTDEQRQAVQAEDLIRLDVMVGYCKTKDCLRGYILDYFGQAHDARCGNCGSCQAEYTMQDLTREAQMILSCIVRMRSRLGYCVGASLICQTLRGSRAARVRELGLDTLPTYGLMRSLPVPRIRELLELLEAEGYVRTDPVYGGIDTTPLAGQVLFHGQTVEVPVKQSRRCMKNRSGLPLRSRMRRFWANSRRSACSWRVPRTCPPISSSPTRRWPIWRPDGRTPRRSCWPFPASARPRPRATARLS